ncbi:MAG: DMT family transporter [Rhodovarius sp.]|nr:DMT family transporter [Rhodovarius sp.]
MIPAWVAFTIAAAGLQCWRTALQQRLRGQLSVDGAAVVRYLYGVPAGLVLLGAYWLAFGGAVGAMDPAFLLLCAAGGLGQIIGTNCLIMSFDSRGFAVGTAYAKTEAIQAAFLAALFFGEVLSPLASAGVAVSLAGVLVLSLAGQGLGLGALIAAARQRGALFGMAAGGAFAVCALFIKAANEALPGDDPVLKALVCLVVINAMQTVMQGGWLLWRAPAELPRLFTGWRHAAPVGALSAAGSACWFAGFALAPVALVRAVGQVEILFTLAASRFWLRERLRAAELWGALTLVGGVVLVLIGR